MPPRPETSIRIGVGGWTYEPWRGVFYPKDLTQKRELEYASRKLTSIEINGTFYGSQKPESFAKWHDETPDCFVFSIKGNRFVTNRKVLAEDRFELDVQLEVFVLGELHDARRVGAAGPDVVPRPGRNADLHLRTGHR